jgi:Ca2+-binding RTX toxin-like protein
MMPKTEPTAAVTGGTPAAAAVAGTLPETGDLVITSISIGTPVEGDDENDAPSIPVSVTLASSILSKATEVSVVLESARGLTTRENVDIVPGQPTAQLSLELGDFFPSGEWALSKVTVDFDTDTYPDLPVSYTFEADEISSLMDSRFVEVEIPQSDITPPTITDLDLPSRGFTTANDNPFGGGDGSVEISFDMTVEDPASGLSVIEFEFDIGPGSPAVVGTELGLFGDIPDGLQELSTFNTEAPAGNYYMTRLRVSDNQGNSHVLTTDDLQEMGYETLVNVADSDALDDSTAPSVGSFTFDDAVTIGENGGTATLVFAASDNGPDDTGVISASLTLSSDVGGLYQFTAPATLDEDSGNWTAVFSFDADFPAGNFTVTRLTVDDAAFNRASLQLTNTDFAVSNARGGDIGDNYLRGNAGDNIITARSGDDTVIGGDGDDTITLGNGNDVSWAGKQDTGNDTVVGGAGDDTIGGGKGDDLIVGGHITADDFRDQLLYAHEERLDGADVLYGGAGDDSLYGGNPPLDGGLIDDPKSYGSVASNIIYGGQGNDVAQGSSGRDTIGGGRDNDTIHGLNGDDVIFGGRGDTDAAGTNDVLSGGEGDDRIYASAGNDVVYGNADNDELYGGSGNDTVGGGGGHDTIYGGTGNDLITGGTGDDMFRFAQGSGADTITDFRTADDTLVLTGYSGRFDSLSEILTGAIVTSQGGKTGLLIDLGEGDSLFLVGITSIAGLDVEF